MSNFETLLEAMHLPGDSELAVWMLDRGVALADEETMSQAVHDVYCGIAADHDEPNAKDHAQALAMIAAAPEADGGPTSRLRASRHGGGLNTPDSFLPSVPSLRRHRKERPDEL